MAPEPRAGRDLAARTAMLQRVSAWVRAVVEPLVTQKDRLSVEAAWTTESALVVVLRTAVDQDRAHLIGREGSCITCLRRLAAGAGSLMGIRVTIEVGDGDGRSAPPGERA
jgi:predicted RNA-binding protein YlqC (UPF0109 family)